MRCGGPTAPDGRHAEHAHGMRALVSVTVQLMLRHSQVGRGASRWSVP